MSFVLGMYGKNVLHYITTNTLIAPLACRLSLGLIYHSKLRDIVIWYVYTFPWLQNYTFREVISWLVITKISPSFITTATEYV